MANALALDDAGSVYVAGATSGSIDGSTTARMQDLFLMKLDSNGSTTTWTKQLGSLLNDQAADIAVKGAYVYVVGTAGGTIGTGTSQGGNDLFIAWHYASTGEQVRIKMLGSSLNDEGHGVTADTNGNVYVVGMTPGSVGGSNAGKNDILLAKYDKNGLNSFPGSGWTKQFGSAENDTGYSVAVSHDGSHLYVTGEAGAAIDGKSGSGMRDVVLASYATADGTKEWVEVIGSSDDDVGIDVVAGENGDVFVLGWTDGGFDGHAYIGGRDVFLLQYSSTGTKLNSWQLGTDSDETGFDIVLGPAGIVYLVGRTNGIVAGGNAGGDDVFVLKLQP
ncbi:MAG: SBBP repeat-containing protein [Pseudomonadota bacterium]